ncbi:MAG: phosphate ABC transporter substrate-binding protein [Gammaproteobacteria bacterium]|nr:phosphate ABC transporter substrate-binding protein [Gammaproteobacteria bacterium]
MPNLRCYPALLAFALAWPAAAGDLVVVTGAHSPINHLSREQVADIYMGRVTTLPGGTSALPLDLPASSPEREAFYNEITGKSAAQVRAYWARMSFTGKGIPPKQVRNDADLKKFAGSKPGAIGYLEENALDGSVKVLFTFK